MKIKDNFVSYTTARRLLKLGFNSECFAGYDMEDTKELFIGFDEYDGEIFNRGYYIPAPLYQQVLQWLREQHNIHISIWKDTLTEKYRVDGIIKGIKVIEDPLGFDYEDSYEVILDKAIEYSLNLIKNKIKVI